MISSLLYILVYLRLEVTSDMSAWIERDMIQQQEVPVKFYSEFCGCVNVVQIEHMSIVF